MLEELIDRFGEPPKSVQNLLAIARMKGMAHRVYIREIVQHENELKLTMYERAKVDPTKIPELIGRNEPALRFVPDTQNPYFCYTLNSNSREKNRDVMEVLEQLLEDMSLLLCGEKAADCE